MVSIIKQKKFRGNIFRGDNYDVNHLAKRQLFKKKNEEHLIEI